MKMLVMIFFLSLSGGTAFCQSQAQLTRMYGEASKMTLEKMDSIYQNILKLYAEDTVFIRNFENSQTAWLDYLETALKAQFPDRPPGYYGSMSSMCASIYSRKIIESRIYEIEKWLEGRKDGDCASSVKSQKNLPPYTPYDPKVIDALRDQVK
jgi:hypothetical protein